ncbi:uncharacterized protein LOC134541594 [Bacillus rossius redtenbacheri]|uniref:uncharacterized protein LOC134541594 n=1 Tax=Bacillus rossius redtenbacheri TaxID=93214 RepID=UPI002FDDC376
MEVVSRNDVKRKSISETSDLIERTNKSCKRDVRLSNSLGEDMSGDGRGRVADQQRGSGYVPGGSARYPDTCSGPFIVVVESLDSNIGNLHPISLGKRLHPNRYILQIQQAGPKRLKMYFSTATAANQFLDSDTPGKMNLRASIPMGLTRKQGIIYGVPLDVSMEEVLDGYESATHKLLHAERLTKHIQRDGQDLRVPIKLLSLTFEGQTLPPYISIFKEIYKVTPKVQSVTMCYQCHRFGHTAKNCRSTTPRCATCLLVHGQACPTVGTPQCVNCRGPHSALNKKLCPMWEREREIKRLMAYHNLSYADATKKLPPSPCVPEQQVHYPIIGFPVLQPHLPHTVSTYNSTPAEVPAPQPTFAHVTQSTMRRKTVPTRPDGYTTCYKAIPPVIPLDSHTNGDIRQYYAQFRPEVPDITIGPVHNPHAGEHNLEQPPSTPTGTEHTVPNEKVQNIVDMIEGLVSTAKTDHTFAVNKDTLMEVLLRILNL